MQMRPYVEVVHPPAIVVDAYLELARSVTTRQRVQGRTLRRLGGPATSRRTPKALGHLQRGELGLAVRALHGSQRIPPLNPSRLPDDVRLTFPKHLLGPNAQGQHG